MFPKVNLLFLCLVKNTVNITHEEIFSYVPIEDKLHKAVRVFSNTRPDVLKWKWYGIGIHNKCWSLWHYFLLLFLPSSAWLHTLFFINSLNEVLSSALSALLTAKALMDVQNQICVLCSSTCCLHLSLDVPKTSQTCMYKSDLIVFLHHLHQSCITSPNLLPIATTCCSSLFQLCLPEIQEPLQRNCKE